MINKITNRAQTLVDRRWHPEYHSRIVNQNEGDDGDVRLTVGTGNTQMRKLIHYYNHINESL